MKFLFCEGAGHERVRGGIFTEDELMAKHGGWFGEATCKWVRNVKAVGAVWSICDAYVLVTVDDYSVFMG